MPVVPTSMDLGGKYTSEQRKKIADDVPGGKNGKKDIQRK